MNAGKFQAATVVQDAQTGALIAFAASDPAQLDVTTPLLPLSIVKVMVAAAWWDHQQQAEAGLLDSERLLTEMIISGNDNAGRRIAAALRKSNGTEAVVKDLERYGFPSCASSAVKTDAQFWAEVPPQ
jgi:hypothetical protein